MHYLRAGIYLETFLVHKWGTDLFVEWSNNELSNVTSEVAPPHLQVIATRPLLEENYSTRYNTIVTSRLALSNNKPTK